MGSRLGYEYRYHFWLDDDILLRYKYSLSVGIKTFLFEIRTNFIIRTTEDEEGEQTIDSERFDACVQETDPDSWFDFQTRGRLKEYWFPEDEIRRFTHEAMDFARQRASDPRHVIPIVVGLDVCTVQQQGEVLGAAMDRAIRAEHLVPLYLCSLGAALEQKPPMETRLIIYLRKLRRIRVEDVDEGLNLMNMCGICGRNPTVGAQISLLQCNHAFHSHCAVQWLEKNSSCPLCDAQAHSCFAMAARALNMRLPRVRLGEN